MAKAARHAYDVGAREVAIGKVGAVTVVPFGVPLALRSLIESRVRKEAKSYDTRRLSVYLRVNALFLHALVDPQAVTIR